MMKMSKIIIKPSEAEERSLNGAAAGGSASGNVKQQIRAPCVRNINEERTRQDMGDSKGRKQRQNASLEVRHSFSCLHTAYWAAEQGCSK